MSADLPLPEFEVGEAVEVLISHRNSTRHVGFITRVVWHYKDACYNYYLEADGRRVSKRYIATDLARVTSNNSVKPNPLLGSA